MQRTTLAIAAILVLATAVPAWAADYAVTTELRPAYPDGYQPTREEDDIQFELGTAYWYSWGAQNVTDTATATSTFTERDNTGFADVHGRIDDLYTNTYLLGRAGIGLHTAGTYTAPGTAAGIGRQSLIGYGSVDYGWLPIGQMKGGFAFGGFLGYQYWKENPDTAGVASDIDINALRLGLRTTADFETFDLQSEVAAVPYAYLSGSVTDRAYGVMTETMVGFRPTENISARVGGRAWYLQNTSSAFSADVLRYGLMAELAGRF